MKQIGLFTLFCILNISIFAQVPLPDEQILKNFDRSKTYFLLDDNIFGTYNNEIKIVADAYWKITKHEYINKDGFEDKKIEPLASILFLSESWFNGNKESGKFNTLSLNMGHESGALEKMPSVVEFPLSYANYDTEHYAYKLGLALKYMQNQVTWMKAHPEIKDSEQLLEQLKNTREKTTGKTLYVLKNEMDRKMQDPAAIKKIYSGKVKFVTKEEIEELIENQDENALILHLVAPDQDVNGFICLKMILGVADAKLYYFDYHLTVSKLKPGAFLKSDFQELSKIK